MSSAGAPRRALERRRERRITVRLPMQVRGTDPEGKRFEETTQTENACRGGVAFPIRRELPLGADVEITILLSRQPGRPGNDFLTRGRIVHTAPGTDRRGHIVGVEFTGPHFHHVLTSESTA